MNRLLRPKDLRLRRSSSAQLHLLVVLSLLVVLPGAAGAGETIFEQVTVPAGIAAPHHLVDVCATNPAFCPYYATGQAWADVDRDGDPDLYLTDSTGPNLLYSNDGDGTFSLSPVTGDVALPGAISGGASFADYDNDGWPDLMVLNRGPNTLLRNLAGAGFEDVTAAAGVGDPGEGESATWGDYDGDGYLDLYTVNWWWDLDPEHPLRRDTLYRNEGDGTFTDVTALLDLERTGGPGFAATFVDFDNDGDQDLYVVNDKLFGNPLWRNDGPGCGGWCFTDVSVISGADRPAFSMGVATGDYDRDGDFDFYYTSINEMILLQNQTSQGSPTFVEVSAEAGVTYAAVGWGTVFTDYDNDGWLDLYVSIDNPDPANGNRLFHNLGGAEGVVAFEDVSDVSGASLPARSFGVATCDYDADGWVDLVVGDIFEEYRLFRNLGEAGAGNHWLSIRLEGGGPVNRDAIGTRVELTLEGGAVLTRQVKSDSSLGSGNDLALHFGLGGATPESARVVWPDGTEITIERPPYDQSWRLVYPSWTEHVFADGFESGDTIAWD